MSTALKRLIYGSTTWLMEDSPKIRDILDVARERNREVSITGLLLHHDGNFLQVLEGPEDVVNSIYQKILRDNRHHGVTLLFHEPVKERIFSDWSMAFVKLFDLSGSQSDSYRDIRQLVNAAQSQNVLDMTGDPVVSSLVRSFVNNCRDLKLGNARV